MDIRAYQLAAHQTEKKVFTDGSDVMVPIFGLAGETGELLNEYKKKLRDGERTQAIPRTRRRRARRTSCGTWRQPLRSSAWISTT